MLFAKNVEDRVLNFKSIFLNMYFSSVFIFYFKGNIMQCGYKMQRIFFFKFFSFLYQNVHFCGCKILFHQVSSIQSIQVFQWQFVPVRFMFLIKHFFLLATVAMVIEKNVFYLFPQQQLLGKQRSSSKSFNVLVQTIPQKINSNRRKIEKKIEEKLSQSSILRSRTKTLAEESKSIKKTYFVLFFTTICSIPAAWMTFI